MCESTVKCVFALNNSSINELEALVLQSYWGITEEKATAEVRHFAHHALTRLSRTMQGLFSDA